jgi:ribosome biogenesis GTPase
VLQQLGWTPAIAARYGALLDARGVTEAVVARVRRVERGLAWASDGERTDWVPFRGDVSFLGEGDEPHVAVGDWVLLGGGPIGGGAAVDAVLPRRGQLLRRRVGKAAGAQIIAANVDTIFIVTTFGEDYSLRRVERMLVAAFDSGAQPVVVLNKLDLAADQAPLQQARAAIEPRASVLGLSALTGDGTAALLAHTAPGATIALIGSSGVGKSTLTNRLLGAAPDARQQTGAVRVGDEKGRHTTTHRELIVAPSGVLLVDGPGVREFGLWEADAGLETLFDDIAALAASCRFGDCGHEQEPGCAVRRARERGELDEARWQAWQQLGKELAFERRRADEGAAFDTKNRWKAIHKTMRARRRSDRRFDGKR